MQAAIYTRISLDRAGEGLGVQRQEQACRAKAKAMGWTVGQVYEENDTSASKGPRPVYEQLMTDLAAGVHGAVVVYSLDRLTRKPAELETFIDLADKHKIALANVAGDLRIETPGDRMTARIMGAVARNEAERIGERVKFQKQQHKESGKALGARFRAFGYNRDWTINEQEAVTLRDIYSRAAQGESIASITKSLNDAGIKTTADGVWRATAVVRVLRRAGNAGKNVVDGVVIGATDYPSIVSEALWLQVEAVLDGKQGPGFNTRQYLLSGICVCSLCHMSMYGNKSSAGRYLCKKDAGGCGRVTMKMSWVDDAVSVAMVERLLMASKENMPAPHDYQADLDAVDARMADLRAAYNANELEQGDLIALLKGENAKRREIANKITEQGPADVILAAMKMGAGEWLDASLSAKRVIIGRYLKAVIIKPTTAAGRRGYDPARIEFLWQDGTTTVPEVRNYKEQS